MFSLAKWKILFVSVGVALSLSGCSTLLKEGGVSQLVVNEDVELKVGRAEAAYQAGQYQRSVELWGQIVDIKPRHVKALYRLGNSHFRLEEVELARDYFERTVKANPRHAKAHYNLAVINLVLAGQHFQFYSATTDPGQNLANVTKILGEIELFKVSQNKAEPTRLERLAKQLSGKI